MYTKILVICVFMSLAALSHTNEIEISSECREQFIRQTFLRDQCHNRLTTANEFYHEFNTTVINFNGRNENLVAVDTFFTKYCDIMPQFLRCFDISNDVSDECRAQIPNRAFKIIVFQALDSLARYACADDAAVLKKLLPHDGFRFLFLNDDLDRCIGLAENVQLFSDLCVAIDRSLPCIEALVANHPNKDIVVITREALNHFKLAGDCEI